MYELLNGVGKIVFGPFTLHINTIHAIPACKLYMTSYNLFNYLDLMSIF